MAASEVAQWLWIPKSTLYKLCQEGGIPAARIGRYWRLQRSAVEKWLADRMAGRARGSE